MSRKKDEKCLEKLNFLFLEGTLYEKNVDPFKYLKKN